MNDPEVLVIGAGHNGLIAACYLARAGKRVLVLERRNIEGGACVTEETWPGYRVSTAAYLCSLLHPRIVEELELRRHGFEVYPRQTAGFAPLPDGRSLFLFPDPVRTREQLQRFCVDTPEDIEAYFAFERDVERAADLIDPMLLNEPPTAAGLRAAFERADEKALFEQFVTGSVRGLLDSRFRSEPLKAMLATDGLIGTYGGPSTPGTAYVLLHHYLGKVLGARGAWGYVRGGMGRITQALASCLREAGGEIRLESSVAQILLESGRAVGVALEDGEQIRAQTLLSNADPYHTFEQLLPQGLSSAGADAPWRALRMRGGASAKINLGVTELPRFTCRPDSNGMPGPEHLGTTHICPGMDYIERAWAEAEQGLPSTEPMIEIYLQTTTDSSLAPPNRHILSLFVQYFPYHLKPGLDLDTERERFANRVIEIIGRYAPNVPGSIEYRQVLTARDLEARFGLTGGHIFHGDLLPPALWADRPAAGFHGARTPIDGLYLCGSGAHPGGCVFGGPGYNAAQAVLQRAIEP